MSKKKDRSHKRYVPRDRESLKLKFEPWRVRAVFDPLESILDQLEQDGTLNVSNTEQAMFKDVHDGSWYDSAAALRGVIDAYEIHERRTGQDLQLEPLRVLATRIEQGQLIYSDDTQAARQSVKHLYAASMAMTVGEARQLINDFNIKEELEKLSN